MGIRVFRTFLRIRNSILFLCLQFVSSVVFAGPQNITFQSKIYNPDGTALEAASVQFKFSLMNPLGTCVIFSETFTAVDLSGSGGSVVLNLGNGTRDYPVAGGMVWQDGFNNLTTSYTCQSSGTYSPTSIDSRRIVMQFNDGGANGWQTLPAMDINTVPYAMFSYDSENLAGRPVTDFVLASALPTCSGSDVLTYDGTNLSCVTPAGGTVTTVTASSPLASSGGATPNITITQASAVSAGYLSSADWTAFNNKLSVITSADISVGAVTDAKIASVDWSKVANTPTTVAGYGITDSLTTATTFSGDISGAYNSTQVDKIKNIPVTLTSIASGDILQYNGSAFINKNIPTCGVNEYLTFNGSVYTCVSDVGAGGTVGSLNSLTGALNIVTGTSGSDFNISSAATTVTLNLPTASSTVRGALSSSDWTTFNSKLANFSTMASSDVATALGYTAANSADLTNYVAKSGSTMTGALVVSSDLTVNSRLLISDGSTASPGFAFSGATNTGLTRNTVAGTMDIVFGGSIISRVSGSWMKSTTSTGWLLPTGSANTPAAPAYSFNGDENMGMYRPASNNLAFSTNSVERLRIIASGDVGIGTATPGERFVVSGGRSTLNTQAHTNAIGSTRNFGPMLWVDNLFGMELGYNGSLWTTRIFTRDSDGAIEFGKYPTGSDTDVSHFSPVMTILNDGNVGIGTKNPGYALEVSGDISVTGNFKVNGTNINSGTVTSVSGTSPISVATGTSTPVISMTQSSGATDGYLSSSDWTTFNNKLSNFSSMTSSDVTTALGYTAANSSDLSTNYVIKSGSTMTGALIVSSDLTVNSRIIAANGSIATPSIVFNSEQTTGLFRNGTGIGFSVAGVSEAVIDTLSFSIADNNFILLGSGGSAGTPRIRLVDFGNGIFRPAANELAFSTNSTERIRIDASGDVGIGITNPGYALEVSGDISVSGNFKINGTNISSGTVTSVSGTSPISIATGTTTPVISMAQATGSVDGYLSSADWTTFNNKLSNFSTLASSDVTTALSYTPITNSLTSGNIFVGNGSNLATGVVLSGDATISNTGLMTLNTVEATKGGTGQSVYVIGDILYASTTTALSRLSASTSGYYLKSNGAGVAPSWQAGLVGTTTVGITSLGTGAVNPATTTTTSVGIGNNTLASVTNGEYNTAVGWTSLTSLTTGTGNTAVGFYAARNTTGSSNSALGNQALYGNTSGSFNIGIGLGAGARASFNGTHANNTTESSNIFIGYSTGLASAGYNNSTAIGANAIIGASNSLILGASGIKVGIGTTTPSSPLSVNPVQYSTGTVSQAATTVTGVGTTFTTAMVGSQLIYANGVSAGTITEYNSATSLTVSTSQTVASQNYAINYSGLNVNSNGNVGIGTISPTAKLTIASSDGTASSAPLKLIAGTNLTTPEAGAIEYDGTNLYYTDSGATRRTLASTGTSGSLVSTNSGTAGSPSIAFSADATTGLYLQGAGSLGVTVSGSNIFNFSSLGMVSATTGGASVSTANGSAAAPTFSFAGDTDTGWFRPAADTMAASTGGTERMRINASGDVGIGATSPDDLLHLKKVAVAAESYPLRLQNRDNTVGAATGLLFKAHTTNADDSYKAGILFERTTGAGRGNMHFLQNNSGDTTNATLANSVMTISNTGDVGIGTTSPSYNLDVNGTNNTSVNIKATNSSDYSRLLIQNDLGLGAYGDLIEYGSTEPGNLFGSPRANRLMLYSAGALSEGMLVGSYTAKPLILGTSNLERMRITASGDVGIGTTSPISTFNVKSTNNTGYLGGITSTEFSNSNYWSMIAKNNGYFYFGNDNGVDGVQDRITFSPTGDLGIGTTSPGSKLHIVDTMSADTTKASLTIQDTAQTNTNGTYFGLGIESINSKKVSSGVSDSGYLTGIRSNTMRNFYTTGDSGTLTNLYGFVTQYGHYNDDVGATPQTTNAYGFYVAPYYQTGTISNLFDIYLAAGAAGGTITNRWGFYQASTSNNYFGGNIAIGTATPGASLDVTGNVKVGSYMKMSSAAATIYVSPSGNNSTGTGAIGAPYLTVTRALQDVPTVLDHDYIIQLVDGSYSTESIAVKGFSGRGSLTIRGNEADANVNSLSVSMAATNFSINNVTVPVNIRNIALTGDSSIASQQSINVYIYRINVNRNTGAGTWAQILKFYQTNYAYVDSSKLVTTGQYGAITTSSGSYVISASNIVTGAGSASTEAGIEAANAGFVYTSADTISNVGHGLTSGETHYGNASGGDIVIQLTDISSSGVCIYNGNGARITEFQAGSYTSCTVYGSTNFGIGSKNPTQKLQVGENGDGTVAIANAWNTFSDIRLKNIISKIPDADDIISKINGYYYTWKNGEDQSRQVGVIAQEIEAVLPELVKTGSDGIKTVDYSKITAVLIESSKNHKREISSLKEENDELKKTLVKICSNNPDLCK